MKNQQLQALEDRWNAAHDKGDLETANQIAIQLGEMRLALGIQPRDTGANYVN